MIWVNTEKQNIQLHENKKSLIANCSGIQKVQKLFFCRQLCFFLLGTGSRSVQHNKPVCRSHQSLSRSHQDLLSRSPRETSPSAYSRLFCKTWHHKLFFFCVWSICESHLFDRRTLFFIPKSHKLHESACLVSTLYIFFIAVFTHLTLRLIILSSRISEINRRRRLLSLSFTISISWPRPPEMYFTAAPNSPSAWGYLKGPRIGESPPPFYYCYPAPQHPKHRKRLCKFKLKMPKLLLFPQKKRSGNNYHGNLVKLENKRQNCIVAHFHFQLAFAPPATQPQWALASRLSNRNANKIRWVIPLSLSVSLLFSRSCVSNKGFSKATVSRIPPATSVTSSSESLTPSRPSAVFDFR